MFIEFKTISFQSVLFVIDEPDLKIQGWVGMGCFYKNYGEEVNYIVKHFSGSSVFVFFICKLFKKYGGGSCFLPPNPSPPLCASMGC